MASGIYLMFQDSIYVAESRVLVLVGKEKLAGLEPYAKDSYNILFQERSQNIHNGIEILKNESLAAAVLERLKPMLQPPPPPESILRKLKQGGTFVAKTLKSWAYAPLYWLGLSHRLSEYETVLKAIRSSLKVEALEDTDIIQISFGWTDPEFAAIAANTFADEFNSQYVRIHQNTTSESFYREQIEDYRQILDGAERELSAFMSEINVTNIELEKEIILNSIADIEAQVRKINLRIEENRALYDGVAEALGAKTAFYTVQPGDTFYSIATGHGFSLQQLAALNSMPPPYDISPSQRLRVKSNSNSAGTFVRTLETASGDDWIQTPEYGDGVSTDLSELDRQYLSLVAQRAQLATTHTQDSTQMLQIEERMEDLRQEKAQNLMSYFSMNMQSKIKEKAVIEKQLEAKYERLHALTNQTARLDELERARNIAKDNYLAYRKKAEELRISDELNIQRISGVRVVNAAEVPVTPSYPRRSLIIQLAALFGLFLGIGYSAVSEYFNHTFREGTDVERILGTKLLMTVPEL
jgi:uncharacterized protein involved in exopolysaccharide biosynthesis